MQFKKGTGSENHPILRKQRRISPLLGSKTTKCVSTRNPKIRDPVKWIGSELKKVPKLD